MGYKYLSSFKGVSYKLLLIRVRKKLLVSDTLCWYGFLCIDANLKLFDRTRLILIKKHCLSSWKVLSISQESCICLFCWKVWSMFSVVCRFFCEPEAETRMVWILLLTAASHHPPPLWLPFIVMAQNLSLSSGHQSRINIWMISFYIDNIITVLCCSLFESW